MGHKQNTWTKFRQKYDGKTYWSFFVQILWYLIFLIKKKTRKKKTLT